MECNICCEEVNELVELECCRYKICESCVIQLESCPHCRHGLIIETTIPTWVDRLYWTNVYVSKFYTLCIATCSVYILNRTDYTILLVNTDIFPILIDIDLVH